MSYIKEIDEERAKKAKADKELLRFPLQSNSYIKNVFTKKPEAVLKVISHSKDSGTKNLLNYVARVGKGEEKELELEDQDGLIYKGVNDVNELYQEWKEDFETRSTNGTKKPTKLMLFYAKKESLTLTKSESESFDQVQQKLNDHFLENIPSNLKSNMRRYGKPREVRHTTHITLSGKTSNTKDNVERVHKAAREFLQERFAKDGYEYSFTTHSDTENPHTHVIIKNKNRETGKKLRLNPVDLLYLRTEYAKSLEKNGIEHKATRRLDRPDTLEKISKGIEQINENYKRYDSQLESKKRINVAARQTQINRQLDNLSKDVLAGIYRVKDKTKVLKELRDLKKKLIIDKNHSPDIVIDSTINMVSKETRELVEITKTTNKKNSPEIERSNRQRRAEERKNKRAAIAKVSANKIKEIDLAIKYISNIKNADPESKKFALQNLQKNKKILHHLVMSNAKSIIKQTLTKPNVRER